MDLRVFSQRGIGKNPERHEGAVGFVIDPSARSTDVLIDASPAYYCNCCGWNFEPR